MIGGIRYLEFGWAKAGEWRYLVQYDVRGCGVWCCVTYYPAGW